MKTLDKIRKLSQELLEENKIERSAVLEKNGFRITNFYSDNVIPIGMISEEDKSILRSYFKGILDDYYYVEKIDE